MPFIDLPPQVSAECDECAAELEYDGISLHFSKDTAAKEVENYEFAVTDGGKVLCSECRFLGEEVA